MPQYRGFDSEALDTAIAVGKPEHKPGASFSFILDRTRCPFLNEVCQLYEAACLNLAVARLSDEHVFRASMVPPASRGQRTQSGGRAGNGARNRPIIVEEIEQSASYELEETTSNMS
ncbi:hypothetical protein JCGZ_05226 [Jatropha curcas]|uniref:Uncharacterized protein n=1 Tax=Jatropha curcas TaxID=180498 RepID=A0A067KNG2_JATCU|nr:hypothetical protein JCGZ_05226 [Jatropha curcas]